MGNAIAFYVISALILGFALLVVLLSTCALLVRRDRQAAAVPPAHFTG